MAGLIPFNRRNSYLSSTGFDDFYNMLDDFFGDSWAPSRSLARDTFKLDVKEMDGEYLIEAELPGVQKDEINLNVDDQILSISVNREESIDDSNANYVHKERRASSMKRSVRLADAKLDEIKAKLEHGVLSVVIPKQEKINTSRKIEIE